MHFPERSSRQPSALCSGLFGVNIRTYLRDLKDYFKIATSQCPNLHEEIFGREMLLPIQPLEASRGPPASGGFGMFRGCLREGARNQPEGRETEEPKF